MWVEIIATKTIHKIRNDQIKTIGATSKHERKTSQVQNQPETTRM